MILIEGFGSSPVASSKHVVNFLPLQESEVTRLQARISSLERAADRQHHNLSLPTLVTHSSQTAADLGPTSPRNPLFVPTSNQPSCPVSPTFPFPPGRTDPPLSNQTHAWSSIDSSLDLPPSLKATLREVFSKQAWESSSPSSSSLQDALDQQGWQGLSAVDTTATSDGSFNPLTYKVDVDLEASPQPGGASELRRESSCTLVGEEEEELDMNSLTGMLRFVNQTLAMQEDPSLWSSSGQAETGHPLPLQVAATPPFGFS